MADDLESIVSRTKDAVPAQSSKWVKLGVLAAASALAGGVAAAWWYRKTLIKLRQVEEASHNTGFRIPEEESADES
jgi:hypothetical protein